MQVDIFYGLQFLGGLHLRQCCSSKHQCVNAVVIVEVIEKMGVLDRHRYRMLAFPNTMTMMHLHLPPYEYTLFSE